MRLADDRRIDESLRRLDALLPDGDAHRAAHDLRADRAHNFRLHGCRNVPIATAHFDVAAAAVE